MEFLKIPPKIIVQYRPLISRVEAGVDKQSVNIFLQFIKKTCKPPTVFVRYTSVILL